jgi:hypothetical protein
LLAFFGATEKVPKEANDSRGSKVGRREARSFASFRARRAARRTPVAVWSSDEEPALLWRVRGLDFDDVGEVALEEVGDFEEADLGVEPEEPVRAKVGDFALALSLELVRFASRPFP